MFNSQGNSAKAGAGHGRETYRCSACAAFANSDRRRSPAVPSRFTAARSGFFHTMPAALDDDAKVSEYACIDCTARWTLSLWADGHSRWAAVEIAEVRPEDSS